MHVFRTLSNERLGVEAEEMTISTNAGRDVMTAKLAAAEGRPARLMQAVLSFH